MAYVVATYYIGWGNRYDGSGNTDLANIELFSSMDVAIESVVRMLRETIEEQVEEDVRDDANYDYDEVQRVLRSGDMYNFEDHIMITISYQEIKSILEPRYQVSDDEP